MNICHPRCLISCRDSGFSKNCCYFSSWQTEHKSVGSVWQRCKDFLYLNMQVSTSKPADGAPQRNQGIKVWTWHWQLVPEDALSLLIFIFSLHTTFIVPHMNPVGGQERSLENKWDKSGYIYRVYAGMLKFNSKLYKTLSIYFKTFLPLCLHISHCRLKSKMESGEEYNIMRENTECATLKT